MTEIKEENLFTTRKSDIVTIGAGNFFLFNSDRDEFIKTVINMETPPFEMNDAMARGVMFEDLLYYFMEEEKREISLEDLYTTMDLVSNDKKYPEEYKTIFKQFALSHFPYINKFLQTTYGYKIVKPKMVHMDFNLGPVTIRVRGIPDFVLYDYCSNKIVELKTSTRTDITKENIGTTIRNCEDYTAFYCACMGFKRGEVAAFTNRSIPNLLTGGTIATATLIQKDISSGIDHIFCKMMNMCVSIFDMITKGKYLESITPEPVQLSFNFGE